MKEKTNGASDSKNHRFTQPSKSQKSTVAYERVSLKVSKEQRKQLQSLGSVFEPSLPSVYLNPTIKDGSRRLSPNGKKKRKSHARNHFLQSDPNTISVDLPRQSMSQNYNFDDEAQKSISSKKASSATNKAKLRSAPLKDPVSAIKSQEYNDAD